MENITDLKTYISKYFVCKFDFEKLGKDFPTGIYKEHHNTKWFTVNPMVDVWLTWYLR